MFALLTWSPMLFTHYILNTGYLLSGDTNIKKSKNIFLVISYFFCGPLEGALVKRNFSRYFFKNKAEVFTLVLNSSSNV